MYDEEQSEESYLVLERHVGGTHLRYVLPDGGIVVARPDGYGMSYLQIYVHTLTMILLRWEWLYYSLSKDGNHWRNISAPESLILKC